MWERYGFYVLQTLLVLYLSSSFGFDDTTTYSIIGSFTALTYISPILGGWIADNLLGQKISITFGGIILMLSYLFISFCTTIISLICCLGAISVGTGLLKPNISSLLGNLYKPDDQNRESGFTIFYMGITTGIILGTTIPMKLVNSFGWPASFISAAFGLLLALISFTWGIKKFKIVNYSPIQKLSFQNLLLACLTLLISWFIAILILKYSTIAGFAFSFVLLLAMAYLVLTAKYGSAEQSKNTISILLLCLISIIFWTFYFQMFSSLTLFIKRLVMPQIFGLDFPPPYYVAIQSIGMLFFGYLLAKIWQKTKTNSVAQTAANKFLLAMCFMVLAYGLILLSLITKTPHQLVLPFFIIIAYLLISVAELLLSPVGLSSITVLATPKNVSTMMGIFFISLGVGGYLSGALAQVTAIHTSSANIEVIADEYFSGFKVLTELLVAGTLLSGLITYGVHKLCK